VSPEEGGTGGGTPPRRGAGRPLSAIQTSWGSVKRLFADDPDTRSVAWRAFHETYRASIVAYVRRFLRRGLGRDPGDELSEEVAQGFLVESYEKGSLARADPAKGRFRAYLQGAIHHYCCNWLDYRNAQRRNPPPGSRLLDLDALRAVGREPAAPGDEALEAFDRAWAATIVAQALASLRGSDPEAAERVEDLARDDRDGKRPALSNTDRSRRHRALERLRAHVAAIVAETVAPSELRNEEWKALAKHLPTDLRPA
jgi:hypothetical protein